MADTFEEKVAGMKDMSEEEMNKVIAETKEVCKDYCSVCPSYTGMGETELAFCALGKSESISEENGCLCGSCPITEKMSLRWGYYCTRGSGREQADIT